MPKHMPNIVCGHFSCQTPSQFLVNAPLTTLSRPVGFFRLFLMGSPAVTDGLGGEGKRSVEGEEVHLDLANQGQHQSELEES